MSRPHRLAHAAALYVAALRNPAERRRPLVFVGRSLRIEPEQARQLIYDARRAGLLLPTQPKHGHIAGKLTALATELLKEGTDHAKQTRTRRR